MIKWRANAWHWAAAVLSGILMIFCFAPWNQTWLAWVALVPVLFALWDTRIPSGIFHAIGLGYVTGLFFFWGVFYWLHTVTVLGWFLLPFYLAIFPALWAGFTAHVARPKQQRAAPANSVEKGLSIQPPMSFWLSSRSNLVAALLCASAWTGQEWLRGWLFTGFGWNGLGVALHKEIVFIQLASLTGVGGLSFLLVLASATIVFSVKRIWMEVGRVALRPHYDFNIAVAIIVVAFSYGIHRIQKNEPTQSLRIAAVQGNIPQNEKWNTQFEDAILETYDLLTGTALSMHPDLIVWPEAATPRGIFNDPYNHDFVERVIRQTDAPLLLGTLLFEASGSYNTAILLKNGVPDPQIYRKIHLVPFGEYVPFRHSFPLFAKIVGDQVPGDFDAGKEHTVFKTEKVWIAPLICFEDTVGRLVRRFAINRPQLLVNITNDGWFLKSAGAEQHLQNAVFRTIENRLPMVRCANTGVTCFIDRYGRMKEVLEDENRDHFLRGTLMGTVQIPENPERTIYSEIGETFSVIALIICATLTGFSFRNRNIERSEP